MAELHAQCFDTPRPWSEVEFATLLQSDSTVHCHVDCGFILGRVTGDEAEVLTIAVAPGLRKQGKGTKLLANFEISLRKSAVRTIFLEVAANNKAAIQLYRTSGFTETGRRKIYYRTPTGQRVDALVLSKHI